MNPLLSLCIPTNGIVEWVVPVLDSIYTSHVDEEQYEVVIEDNGENIEFEKKVLEYKKVHSNIKYHKSTAVGFLCQIDCFRHANGEFIKFVNHRTKLVEGALEYMLGFVRENIVGKPVVFFSNENVARSDNSTFDDFVLNLSYWSSWSGGLAFWKEDIELVSGKDRFNSLFPHTDVLFAKRNAERYIILDKKIFSEIDTGHASKGKYNLFMAFAVEYLSIINDMLREEAISVKTFLKVKDSLLSFISDLYIRFIIRREVASYSFNDYKDYLQIYYSRTQLFFRVLRRIMHHLLQIVLPIRSIKRKTM